MCDVIYLTSDDFTVTDPRIWTKEDVAAFIQWAEIEFDLPRFDTELFQMNGKALCLLTKQDLGERCPGAGDLLYNVLQLLRRGGDMVGTGSAGHLPSSPVTSHFPFSPTWCLPAPSSPAVLSPAPSIDSQSESPRHMEYQQPSTTVGHHLTPSVSIFPTTQTVGEFNLSQPKLMITVDNNTIMPPNHNVIDTDDMCMVI